MKETALFGGGCFWCTEAVFNTLRGILSVTSGYSGGHTENPTDREVYSGTTGHAEVVKVEFDPSVITYDNLLTVFFGSHDATQLNRQAYDVGTGYRSIILYTTEEQKKKADTFIEKLNASAAEGKPIVTEVVPYKNFYEAEEYHQNFYGRENSRPDYCELIIEPKLQKVQKEFAQLLKTHEK